ncbi:uncharacterized protein G2W53_030631 [Senna tora]|uniref:Uncharacterized protein n=1 Tax=Senna tora TaxID=362788 RepID=A0A834T9F7_9FABA|nr:uncharacterized protein G2W53_030631 [Senna tora]
MRKEATKNAQRPRVLYIEAARFKLLSITIWI